MDSQSTERRPGVILGVPAAILLLGVVCLLVAGFFSFSITYEALMLCYYGCPGTEWIVYVARPLLYLGWLLVFAGACSLVFPLIFGRSRPAHTVTFDPRAEGGRPRGYPGLEEPALLPPRGFQ